MCLEAPVAQRAYHDDATRYPGHVTFLGIIGDQSHQARTSSHNCAPRQESPVNGMAYDPGYAHALDTGVDSTALGREIVAARIRDPRVRYCIFQGVGYYGQSYRPGGGTFRASGHPHHVHTSFLPGTTHDTSPFYQNAPSEDLTIMDPATKKYLETEFDNITTRDAAMQRKFAEDVEAVDQKSRRIVVDIIEAVVEVAELDKAKVRARLGAEAQKVWDKVD